jgi:sugar lactone lactonase YvrE
VGLVDFSTDSTETVSFAGSFPPDDEDPLDNPLALDGDDDRIYVAESEASRVRVFSVNGGPRGEIVVPAAQGAPQAYVADVALIDDDLLAVVDTAGQRVLLLDADPEAETAAVATVGEQDAATAPRSPTAVAFAGGRLVVADTAAGAIRRYDTSGRYVDEIPLDLVPSVGTIGGLSVRDTWLYVSDSTSGRVLVLDTETGAQVRVLDKVMGLPRGVALDGRGNAYVCDRFAGRIEVFDAEGSDTDSFGEGGRGGIALAMPTDAWWLEVTSRLYVVDATVGRVAVFNIREAANGESER